jgi:hypothetical protein
MEDFINFILERLISVIESLSINKAEIACMLNLSAIEYGRYEKGEPNLFLLIEFARQDENYCLAY